MTFLHPALLIGLAAVALPIILHLLLKQKPKKLLFPALRLIEQRRKQSTRRLRMKQFWLLLLRMLVLALIVFALSRPSLPPADYSLSLSETVTLLVVIAFGMATYFFILSRWKRQLVPQFVLKDRQSRLRGWTTGATLLAVLLAVGLPYGRRVAAEIRAPVPARQIDMPVAGILIFDTSLSMSYQQEGKTYLDRARELARSHLEVLPDGSKIAVADTASDNPILFQSALPAAVARIEALQTAPVSLAINDRIRDAARAHLDDQQRTLDDQSAIAEELRKDRFIRRVYVFTDLARSAWRQGASQLLKGELAKNRTINLYLLDVSEEQPRNLALTRVDLSRERIPEGGELIVSATLEATGLDPGEQVLELYVNDAQGQPAKLGQATVQVESGTPVRCEFPAVTDITGPTLQGDVRLATTDPLSFDNALTFAADVAPAPKILVVAPDRATATPWMAALAPFDKLSTAKNAFDPQFTTIGRLPEMSLSQFPTVCLINVARIPDDTWYQLGKYVENGGGLALFLGSTEVSPPSYNRAQAQQFLPARLDVYKYDSQGDWRFVVDDNQHPLFRKFRQYESYGSFAMLENDVAITRFWRVEPSEQAGIIARYTDAESSPAILERVHGRGRTVIVTTGVDLPENYRLRWNNFPSTLLPSWLFYAFAEQMMDYVSRATDTPHNFIAGETPIVRLSPADSARDFLLQQPQFKQSRQRLPAGEGSLTLESANDLGHYQLIETGASRPITAFTINPAPSESDLTRLTRQQLDDLLGKDHYQLARTLNELKDQINASDLGKEVFPIVLALLIVAFLGEHLVANRFYENDGNGDVVPARETLPPQQREPAPSVAE